MAFIGMLGVPPFRGTVIRKRSTDGVQTLLSDEALHFLQTITRRFEAQRSALLRKRREDKERLLPVEDFFHARKFSSRSFSESPAEFVPQLPEALANRRLEMVIPPRIEAVEEALKIKPDVITFDFDTMLVPTWENVLSAHQTLLHANRRKEAAPLVFLRPRDPALFEKHVLIDGKPIPAIFFDIGLYLFHCRKTDIFGGTGACLYLSNIENQQEAVFWSEVITYIQQKLQLPSHFCRVSVLVDRLSTAFYLEEIMLALGKYVTGVAWDEKAYRLNVHSLFGMSKQQQLSPSPFPPGRDFRGAALKIVQTCHRYGITAIGDLRLGLEQENGENQKLEAVDGFDGGRAADEENGLSVRQQFQQQMPWKNQTFIQRNELKIEPCHLVHQIIEDQSEKQVRADLRGAIIYMEEWLRGTGLVKIDGTMWNKTMFDLARIRIRNWFLNGHETLAEQWLNEELQQVQKRQSTTPVVGKWEEAGEFLKDVVFTKNWIETFIIPAYDCLD